MKKLFLVLLVFSTSSLFGQNLELTGGKDITQPGKVNPSLAGVQEDLVRLLTDAEIGQSYQLMLEGRLPLKLGNYMVGVERTFTDDVTNNMFNLTYARKSNKKKNKKFQWRYGGSLQFNTKSLTTPGFDSSSGYTFQDINGQTKSVKSLDELRSSVDYVDLVLGGSMTYNNLMAGLSLENFLGSDLSLTTVESRKLPFTTNFIFGGFLTAGKYTLFPSAVVMLNSDDFYAKTGVDFSAEKFNLAAVYIAENNSDDDCIYLVNST